MKSWLTSLLLFITLGCATVKPQSTPEFFYMGTITEQGFLTLALNITQNLPNNKNIVINVDSPGGEVYPMLELVSILEALKNKGYVVTVKVHNMCASACFTLLQSANKRIVVGTKVLIVVHNVRRYEGGKVVFDQFTQNTSDSLTQYECLRIKTVECIKVLTELKHKDTYIRDTEELLRLGYIDKVI